MFLTMDWNNASIHTKTVQLLLGSTGHVQTAKGNNCCALSPLYQHLCLSLSFSACTACQFNYSDLLWERCERIFWLKAMYYITLQVKVVNKLQ